MTTAQQFGDRPQSSSRSSSYYDYRYSPPVSPKSQPHANKRKASSQDDDLEHQSLISNTFKKLRLHNTQRPSAAHIAPVGVSYRATTQSSPPSVEHPASFDYGPARSYHGLEDEDEDEDEKENDFMPIDDTADRIWVHDLDAEIAAIEAEEARHRDSGIELSEAGKEYAKIPDHLLKQSTADHPASNMQMILYQDPISISVSEEDDAVRKTVIEARRRMREQQQEDRDKVIPHALPGLPEPVKYRVYQDDDVDMDLD